MKGRKTAKIDFSRERLALQADKYYNEGKFIQALRLANRELKEYGGDGDVYVRFCDIYEGMNLHASAINFWFRFLDEADEQDLPDIYEGLAVNYLNLGMETHAAYYYNQLIDVDDTISEETKMDIVQAFAKDKKDKFRFVYPPERADYTEEMDRGSEALKRGDCKAAIAYFSSVCKDAKEYVSAKEMQAVAHLLDGDNASARSVCEDLLAYKPDDVRALATLAAVALEEGNADESLSIALRLSALEITNTEELYKVATVCCENGLHKQAYEKFCRLEEKMPYDGRMLYFKAVAAFKCGLLEEAERTLDTLCTIYSDAEVAKYYLHELRVYRTAKENGEENVTPPVEPSYFYQVPTEVKKERFRFLAYICESPVEEAQLFALMAWHDGYFRWCFDEMDGADHELQCLALRAATHARADDFLREVLLDDGVLDVFKIETLRELYLRNEEMDVGVVLNHVYRLARIRKIKIGRKRRKRFIEGYAKLASKFVLVQDKYVERMQEGAEEAYRGLERAEALELIESSDDCAYLIYLFSGFHEFDKGNAARIFDADEEKVRLMLATAMGPKFLEKYLETKEKTGKGEGQDETH